MSDATDSTDSTDLVSPPSTISLGGTTYLISAPTEKEVFAVLQYAKKHAARHYNPIRDTMDAIKDLACTEEQRTALIMQAQRVQLSKEIPSDIVSEFVMSPKGCAFYFWVLARKQHPALTLEQSEALINEDNSVLVWADLDEASGVNMIHSTMGESIPFFHRP